ncbi:MAG: hypothetical protein QOH73_1565 [Gaiellaceae bacterium]|nr:hypothetical protein [Gaiellaceae bacterium]
MTVSLHPKLNLYAVLGAVGLPLGPLLGRPELALFGAPFLLALLLDMTAARPRGLRAQIDPLPEQLVEGDELTVTLELTSDVAVRADIVLVLPAELELREGNNPRTVALKAGQPERLAYPVRCVRWGLAEVGPVAVRAFSPFGLVRTEQELAVRELTRILPDEPTLRELVRPHETQLFAGNQRARAKSSDGIEFADLRDYQPGDRPRSINWRASARRGELQTNQRHLERNADVTILVDSFGNGARGSGSTFDDAVRAASALVRHSVAQRDRVGLINLGGTVRWIELRSGIRQLYQIVGTLLEAEAARRTYGEQLGLVPRRVLSPGALVIALTPLLDGRSVDILLDLRARGYDLLVVEVVAEPKLAAGADAEAEDAEALRLWRVVREGLRARFLRHGIPLVRWQPGIELEAALGEVRAFRRRGQSVRA